MIDDSHLWRRFQLTFENGNVVACVIFLVELTGVFAREFTYIFEAYGCSEEHAHHFVVHFFSELEGLLLDV